MNKSNFRVQYFKFVSDYRKEIKLIKSFRSSEAHLAHANLLTLLAGLVFLSIVSLIYYSGIMMDSITADISQQVPTFHLYV